jgi:putative acyl-CoA dehydrogenase
MSAVQRDATNQSPPLEGLDRISGDVSLVQAMRALAGDTAGSVLGLTGGSRPAERNRRGARARPPGQTGIPPKLTVADRYGNRIEEVRFHPPGTG